MNYAKLLTEFKQLIVKSTLYPKSSAVGPAPDGLSKNPPEYRNVNGMEHCWKGTLLNLDLTKINIKDKDYKLEDALLPEPTKESYSKDKGEGKEINPKFKYRFHAKKFLGRGAFGATFMAYDNKYSPPRPVAIKVMMETKETFIGTQEANALCWLNRKIEGRRPPGARRLPNLHLTFFHQDRFCIVMELYEKFPVREYTIPPPTNEKSANWKAVCQDPNKYRRLKRLSKIAFQILTGVHHMHRQGVIHADIKPDNILRSRTKDSSLRICDFGNTIILDQIKAYSNCSEIQTLPFRAPELLAGLNFNYTIDTWSIGIILCSAITGRHPFYMPDSKEKTLGKMVERLGPLPIGFYGQSSKVPTELLETSITSKTVRKQFTIEQRRINIGKHLGLDPNELVVSFIEGLLRLDPRERFTSTMALSHPYLSELIGLDLSQFPTNTTKVAPVFGDPQNISKPSIKPRPGGLFRPLAPPAPNPTSIPAPTICPAPSATLISGPVPKPKIKKVAEPIRSRVATTIKSIKSQKDSIKLDSIVRSFIESSKKTSLSLLEDERVKPIVAPKSIKATSLLDESTQIDDVDLELDILLDPLFPAPVPPNDNLKQSQGLAQSSEEINVADVNSSRQESFHPVQGTDQAGIPILRNGDVNLNRLMAPVQSSHKSRISAMQPRVPIVTSAKENKNVTIRDLNTFLKNHNTPGFGKPTLEEKRKRRIHQVIADKTLTELMEEDAYRAKHGKPHPNAKMMFTTDPEFHAQPTIPSKSKRARLSLPGQARPKSTSNNLARVPKLIEEEVDIITISTNPQDPISSRPLRYSTRLQARKYNTILGSSPEESFSFGKASKPLQKTAMSNQARPLNPLEYKELDDEGIILVPYELGSSASFTIASVEGGSGKKVTARSIAGSSGKKTYSRRERNK